MLPLINSQMVRMKHAVCSKPTKPDNKIQKDTTSVFQVRILKK